MNFRAGDRVITSSGYKKKIAAVWRDYAFFEDTDGYEIGFIIPILGRGYFHNIPGLEKGKRYNFASFNNITLRNRRMDV